jgi:hypothetical protein
LLQIALFLQQCFSWRFTRVAAHLAPLNAVYSRS